MGRSLFARVVSILDWVGFTFDGYSSILIWGDSVWIGAGVFGGVAVIGPYFRSTRLCLRFGAFNFRLGRLYFGLGGEHPLTLEEIGERFDLTRERVRQIKEKASRRLKHTSRSRILKSYLG